MEQIRFIERWESEGETFLELCRAFGISRKTGYKRVQRFRAWGWDGLGDLSRAPHRHPNQTRREVVERLIVVRQEHPTWGPKKLVAWLRDRDSETHWPAPARLGTCWTRPGWYAGARDADGQRLGASPLPKRSSPTTCGASTSRAGFAPATVCGSTPLPWRMPPPGISWRATGCASPEALKCAGFWREPSGSTVSRGPSAPTTARLLPA